MPLLDMPPGAIGFAFIASGFIASVFLAAGAMVPCGMALLLMLLGAIVVPPAALLLMEVVLCASAAPELSSKAQTAAEKMRDFMGKSPVIWPDKLR